MLYTILRSLCIVIVTNIYYSIQFSMEINIKLFLKTGLVSLDFLYNKIKIIFFKLFHQNLFHTKRIIKNTF